MDVEALRKLIGTQRDNALLRMTLASALLNDGLSEEAQQQLVEATRMDPTYSAAWKQLGKVRLACEDAEGARTAWQSGVEAARARGDKQAEKEMLVFLRRLDKSKL